MKQFEYKIINYTSEKEMNQLGLKGWEAYAVVWNSSEIFLKRELIS